MASTIGGNDPAHDLPEDEKDKREKALLEEAQRLFRLRRARERKKKLAQAQEISRRKSSAAQHH